MDPYYPANGAPQGGKLRRFFRDGACRPHRTLFYTGSVLGLGFLGYLMLSMAFSLALRDVPALNDMYFHEPLYQYLLEIVYSVFCVGFPFLIVILFLKRTQLHRDLTVPLGRSYAPGQAVLLVPAAVGVCFAGSLLSNYIAAYADSVGFGFQSYYDALEPDVLPDGPWGLVVLILRTALIPAVVEELIFRGVILQSLRKFGDWFAIVSSALLFGLMHANMTQTPFALIAGVALGYCAVVTGTLKTSIVVHFLNNLTSVIITLVISFYGDGPAAAVSNAVIFGGIGLGLAAFAGFAFSNRGFLRLYPGAFGYIRGKGRCLFLSPLMLIAVLWLLWYTLNDITAFASWIGG